MPTEEPQQYSENQTTMPHRQCQVVFVGSYTEFWTTENGENGGRGGKGTQGGRGVWLGLRRMLQWGCIGVYLLRAAPNHTSCPPPARPRTT